MEKNKYTVLIVLLCIAAALLAGFLALHIVRGGRTIIRNIEENTALYELCYDESFDNTFTEIALKSNAGDMSVVPSGDGKVHVRIWADEKKVKVTAVGTTLNITANAEGKVKIGINTYNKRLTKIELALPADYSGEISVKSNYGNLEADAFPQASFKANCDYGNLDIDAAAGLKAECAYGNVTVGTLSERVNIKADYGNVEIDTLALTEDGSIECEAGNVEIGAADTIGIESETEVGSADIRPNPATYTATLKIETEVGNITVK